MSTETFEQTFEVKTPARLRVSNVRGHVDVQPGEDGIINVTAVKHQGVGGNGKTKIFIGQESDGLVIVEAKYENSITDFFGINKPCKVDFSIRVPHTCSVKVNCVSSSATINGLEGDFEVQGVSGDINLANMNGTFDFNSVSGKITAENLIGPLEMNNVSGKVQITESQIPSMIGKSVSGSAIIETPLTEGPYEFKSVSGNMSVITPEDTACTISIKSVSGVAKVNLPVTSRTGVRNKEIIEVAGGGPQVSMKSVSGVLKVGSPNYVKSEEPQPEKEIAPSPVVPPAIPATQPKSQMQILQELENGEISVDEALELMNP